MYKQIYEANIQSIHLSKFVLIHLKLFVFSVIKNEIGKSMCIYHIYPQLSLFSNKYKHISIHKYATQNV